MSPQQRKPYRLPPMQSNAAEQLKSDVQLFGQSWNDSALCLPWADWYGTRLFAVHSPSYGGDVWICSFRPRQERRCLWWNEPMQIGISGVTHWRLAEYGEQDYWLDPACWPEQGAMGLSFEAQRMNWLYCDGPCEILR